MNSKRNFAIFEELNFFSLFHFFFIVVVLPCHSFFRKGRIYSDTGLTFFLFFVMLQNWLVKFLYVYCKFKYFKIYRDSTCNNKMPYFKVTRSVFDLIPIIITMLIFVLITNQPAHNSQVDRPACVAWMSMVMRMKNGNGFEIEYWPRLKLRFILFILETKRRYKFSNTRILKSVEP